jgi:hypothetical protein
LDKLWDLIIAANVLHSTPGWPILDIDETYALTGETMWEAYHGTAVVDAPQTPEFMARESSRSKGDHLVCASGAELSKNTAMYEAVISRCLARTGNGFIGLVPAEAREGDVLYLLKDGKVVYALREDSEHHLFIGESYVHSLMYGEIVGTFNETQLRPRTLTIK